MRAAKQATRRVRATHRGAANPRDRRTPRALGDAMQAECNHPEACQEHSPNPPLTGATPPNRALLPGDPVAGAIELAASPYSKLGQELDVRIPF